MNAESIKQLNLLLKEFAFVRGLPEVVMDETRVCTMNHPEGMALNLELTEDGSILHWYATLGEVPFEGREPLYVRMLEMNLLCIETGGATLALNPPEVVLCYSQPMEGMNAARLANITENFLATALRLKEEIFAEEAGAVAA